MPTIGVSELREHTAEILRRVREEKADYIITYKGRPIALLLPLAEPRQVEEQHAAAGWEYYARVAEELRRAWPQNQDTQTLLAEIRQS